MNNKLPHIFHSCHYSLISSNNVSVSWYRLTRPRKSAPIVVVVMTKVLPERTIAQRRIKNAWTSENSITSRKFAKNPRLHLLSQKRLKRRLQIQMQLRRVANSQKIAFYNGHNCKGGILFQGCIFYLLGLITFCWL